MTSLFRSGSLLMSTLVALAVLCATARRAEGAVVDEIVQKEKQIIESTLLATRGNKAQTARILGLGRKTLYRKIQEYGIE